MKSIVLCALLFVSAYAVTEVVVENVEIDNYIDGSDGGLSKGAGAAATWLFQQRNLETGWGPFTPRAVTALALARRTGVFSIPAAEWSILTKLINVMLAIEIGSDTTGRDMNLSRLAHYIHALRATCQDPRHFHGTDLVAKLRAAADGATGDSAYERPIVFIALCLEGQVTHGDLHKLSESYSVNVNNTDLQSLHLLAMSCITEQQQFASARPAFTAYLRNFASRFRQALRLNATDVFTKALAVQALHSGDAVDPTGMSSLFSNQDSNGSFENSLLATYYAIPALLGLNILSLAGVHCENSTRSQRADASDTFQQSSAESLVQLTLWIGENAERNTYTSVVPIGRNDTLLHIMRKAQAKNNVFRFSYDATPTGAVVYSISGIPNDSEREVRWKLYIQKHAKNEHLRELKKGVDKVYPKADDQVVFWYKRDSA